MKSVTITLQRPHESQLSVLREHKRFNVLCCGRRWGKTTIAIERIVRPALAGKATAWFSPTYRSLSDAWRELQRVLHPLTVRKSGTEHRLELYGGGVVECWSLDDPDAGRGRAYHAIVVDEAAKVVNLDRAWLESMRPMLSDYEGSAWFLSTPRGTANYFHALFRRGQDPEAHDWASWQQPTRNNPYITRKEIADMRSDMTELAFAQECLAEFVTWTGAVFRKIGDAVRPVKLEPAAIIGVDWGFSNDYTVFTAVSAAGHVVGVERFRGVEYALQRERLAQFWKHHGSRAWIMAEVNAAEAIIQQLRADGLPVAPFRTTQASKAAIIQGLALGFERDLIVIPDDPVLVGELQAYEGKPTTGGVMQYGAPSGQHDDTVMSLAFAWAGLTTPRTEVRYLDLNAGGGYSQSFTPYQISPI